MISVPRNNDFLFGRALGVQCHFSWFILRPYLGVGSSMFQEIVPINVPKTLRLTCLFWFRDDRLHNCDDPNGSLKNFELQQKIKPYRESDRVTTSRLCFWYRSLPCFSMLFFDAASEVNFSEARSSRSSRLFNPGAAMIPCSESGCFLSKICGSLFSVPQLQSYTSPSSPQFANYLRISLHLWKGHLESQSLSVDLE